MTKNLKTLVLLEGHEANDLTLVRAARKLASEGELNLLRVRPLPERSIPRQSLAARRLEPWEQMRFSEASDRVYLAGIARRALGRPAQVQVRFGDPVAETLEAVATVGAGLVVAPSLRGRDGRLARALPVPILLVTADEKAPVGTASQPVFQA